MAIKLEVQPYCRDCTIFEAEVEVPSKYVDSFNMPCQTDTIIRCGHRNTCAGLMRYLKKEMQKGEKE